jgi:NAD(P)-dependent dehydrogenase (short-subunit alcohol dehydrogenase family)
MNAAQTLHNITVFIQGAGRAPGPQLARAFAAQGAKVAAVDLSPILLDPVSDSGEGLSGMIRTFVGDTSRGMPARAILDEVASEWGPVEILINNPRIAPNTSVLQTDEWDWQRTIESNLNGAFLLMHLTSRAMVELGRGVVVNLIAEPGDGLAVPGRAAYAASQLGMLGLTRTAALELMAYNIRVYGACLEEQIDAALTPVKPAPCRWTGELTPQASVLQTEFTLEELVLLLCSPAAVNIPGQVFHVRKDP